MVIIFVIIILLTSVWKDGFVGLDVISVRNTFILPEEYLVLTAMYIVFIYIVMSRTDIFFKENYFCRIRSRYTYVVTEIILINICVIALWGTSLAAGSKYAGVRLAFLFVSCNIQMHIKLLFSKQVSLMTMFSQLILSMFCEHHILFGDIAMECRAGNVKMPIIMYSILIICMWIFLIKRISKMDVISYDN